MRQAAKGPQEQRKPASRVRHALLALALVLLAGSTVADRMDVWDPTPAPAGGPVQAEVDLVTQAPPARRGKAPGFGENGL